LGACSNAFRDFPDKSSDAYYIDQAEIFLNQFKFAEAIDKITPVLATQPRNPKVVQIAMLAYAGRAGLRSLDLITELTDGSSNFFTIFAEHFPGATDVNVSDMNKAIEILEAYEPDATQRTTELNLIAMFLYYGRIGVVLHRYAYVNNVRSPTFNQCSTTDLPDAALTLIVRSLPRALDSTSGLGSGGLADALNSLTSEPLVQAFVGSENSACPTDTTPCQSMRALIGEGDLGIGIGTGPVITCP
jgi:hypothetical protein